jgi:hypothetical protein
MGILRDVIGISANHENSDYRSLRKEGVIATGPDHEISTLYRKSRAMIMEDDNLHDLKNKTSKTNMTIPKSHRRRSR